MKYIIASDIHGSARAAEKIIGLCQNLNPDRPILLGDLLYHDPRNPPPDGYDPQKAAELFNSCKDAIVAVRGNCDAEIDWKLLEFPCSGDYVLLADGDRTFFLTHGHLYREDCLPIALKPGAFFLAGHTHVWRLEERNGVVCCNPGSAALPKGPSPVATYAFYDNGCLGVYSLETNVLLAERKPG
jgi:putative phosphoesterase